MLNEIWSFVNSSFFIALVTLLAGLFAFWIYNRRNKDIKKDAANILLLEIQNAERQLRAVKEKLKKDDSLADDIYLMPTSSWDKYQYLFVRDLDRDEWDTIVNFYDKCKLIDQAVSSSGSYFQKNEEQIRINMHRITSDFIKDLIETGYNPVDEKKKKEFIDKATVFQNEYLAHPDLTLYNPKKPVNDAKLYLENLSANLSQTSIGSKLKLLAKGKKVK